MSASNPRRVLLVFDWYWETMHEGALKFANEQGWEVRRVTSENFAKISSDSFDGILSGVPLGNQPLYQFVAQAGVPVVDLSLAHPEHKEWGRFASDPSAVGRLAAEHLRSLPVSTFLFTAHSSSLFHNARWESFRSALAQDPRSCQRFDVGVDDTAGIGRMAEHLLAQSKPIGIFGSVDDSALIALSAAQKVGLKVPGDVYILGFGNLRLVSGMAPVPISSIPIDHRVWAYEAMKMLGGMMDGSVKPGTLRYFPPGEVIVRSSTTDMPQGDPLCERALEIMRSRVSSPIMVEDLAKNLGVSESSLRRAFSEHLGMSVAACYLAMRLEVAKGLLAAGLKVEAVGASVGFASPRAFRAAFLKAFGYTPGSVLPKKRKSEG